MPERGEDSSGLPKRRKTSQADGEESDSERRVKLKSANELLEELDAFQKVLEAGENADAEEDSPEDGDDTGTTRDELVVVKVEPDLIAGPTSTTTVPRERKTYAGVKRNLSAAEGSKSPAIVAKRTRVDYCDYTEVGPTMETLLAEKAALKSANEELTKSNELYAESLKTLASKVSALSNKMSSVTEEEANNEATLLSDMLHDMMNDVAAEFFNSQMRNCKADKKKMFTTSDVVLAFAIYNQSPQCYVYLSKFFALPGVDLLLKWLESVDIIPGSFGKQFFADRALGFMLSSEDGQVGADVENGLNDRSEHKTGMKMALDEEEEDDADDVKPRII